MKRSLCIILFILIGGFQTTAQDLRSFVVYENTLYIGFDNIELYKSEYSDKAKGFLNYYVFYSERYFEDITAGYLNGKALRPSRAKNYEFSDNQDEDFEAEFYESEEAQTRGETDFIIKGMIVLDEKGGLVFFKSEEILKDGNIQYRVIRAEWNFGKKMYEITVDDKKRSADGKIESFELKTGKMIPVLSYLISFAFLDLKNCAEDEIALKALDPFAANRTSFDSQSSFPAVAPAVFDFTINWNEGKYSIPRFSLNAAGERR